MQQRNIVFYSEIKNKREKWCNFLANIKEALFLTVLELQTFIFFGLLDNTTESV